MTTRYSKATGNFYPCDIDYGANLPADIIDVSLADFQSAMARPAGYTFDFVSGNLIISAPAAPPLTDLRAQAIAALPAWEQAERAAGIEHAGRAWLTTPAALQDIRDALLAGMVPGDTWIDAARTPVPMTLPDLQSLWGAIVTAGAAIYQRRLQMEAEIAAMDADQLAAFKPGWPA